MQIVCKLGGQCANSFNAVEKQSQRWQAIVAMRSTANCVAMLLWIANYSLLPLWPVSTMFRVASLGIGTVGLLILAFMLAPWGARAMLSSLQYRKQLSYTCSGRSYLLILFELPKSSPRQWLFSLSRCSMQLVLNVEGVRVVCFRLIAIGSGEPCADGAFRTRYDLKG